MESYKNLLHANKIWVDRHIKNDPSFFENLAKDHKPEFLWIGCSDSRVPAERITGTQPGELFVHRNIANMVVNTDVNMLSVLQFAVDFLKVNHIIVCGHYGCGGIQAAISHRRYGLLNKWLRNIKDVYRLHQAELENLSEHELTNRLAEFNVVEQVYNLAKTSIIQRAWHFEKRPLIHGWVYGLDTGLLKDIIMIGHETQLDPIYQFDFSDLKTGNPD
ncbi:MAG: carbonate dehydratase [Gammaproteobacteria bacterium]|nr:carbonate dehydratase [Gammaproteobacteria bacterium]MCP5424454.1 carbonate dehydratase [Gammaproteobacteria bacterium]MCP5458448.1 carbonate dehydratase [Gammaproteobacteria bacterium]